MGKDLISDETAFQLFKNTITQWYKGIDQLDLFPRIDKRFSRGADFVLKAKPLYIASQGSWMLSFI